MAEDEDPVALAAKLPLPDRVTHKVWKVREAAYRELADKFNTSEEDSKLYPDFAPLLLKIIRDANAAAQLVGLEAVAMFADRAPPNLVKRFAPEVAKAIVEKALTGRPLNKQKAADVIVMFVGADAGDAVCETFASLGFAHSSPKVAATAVDIVRDAVVTYGASAVPLKPIATAVTPLFAHSNEPVRKAAKALAIELHRWIGDAARAVVKDAPDVTVKEMQAAFDEHAGQPKPVAKKLTRAMEQRVRNAPPGGNGDDADDGFNTGDAVNDEDFDLSEEVDILPMLSKMKFEVEEGVMKDWFVAVESKKWNIRKDALASALEAIGTSRITPGPFSEVFSRLRKVLAKDSNVNVVAHAAKLVGAIAAGLRKDFPTPAAKIFTVDLLARLKDKNRIVTDAVCSALDILHKKRCILVYELGEEISTAAENKVPKVRSELFRWLDRCFRYGTSAANLKGPPLKVFGTLLVVGTEDSTPEVRDAAVAALASLQVLVGERNMLPFFEKLDKLRMDKIAAIVKELPPPQRVPPASSTNSDLQVRTTGRAGKAKPSGSNASAAAPHTSSKPSADRSTVVSHGNALPTRAQTSDQSDDEGEIQMTFEDALELAAKLFDYFDQEGWIGKAAKARADQVSVISKVLEQRLVVSSEEAFTVLGLLAVPPSISDTTFFAWKGKLELLGLLARKCDTPLPRKSLRALLDRAVEMLGDIKCAIVASDIIMQVGEATSARYLFGIVSEAALRVSDARAKLGITKFALSMVKDFGLPAVPLREAVKLVAELLNDPPPQMRNAALSLAAELAARSDAAHVRSALESASVDTKLLDQLDAELSKRSGYPDKPTRAKRLFLTSKADKLRSPLNDSRTHQSREEDSGVPALSLFRNTVEGKADTQASEVDVLVKRASIGIVRTSLSQHFTQGSPILQSLKNANWKIRQDALAAVDALVSQAGCCIESDVGPELMTALRARLSDSNRNIAVLAYTVTGHVGHAMGPGAYPHAKVVIPVVLSSGCVDIKKNVRDAALTCLDLWFQALGLSPLLPYLATPLGSLNPGFRREFLEWLLPRLRGEVGSFSSAGDDLSHLIEPCLSCLRDRTVEVRQRAELMLDVVVASVGFSAIDNKVIAMNKAARLQLEPYLGKYRGSQPGASFPVAASRPQSRVPPRERPKSMASPRAPSVAALHGMDTVESSTPRSGLRRARPASMRPPASGGGESQVTLATAASGGAVLTSMRPLLRPGSGRTTRGERVALRKALVRKDEEEPENSVAGVEEFVPERPDDIAADLRECVPDGLLKMMIAPSNRFQSHVESIDELTRVMREDPDTLVKCADVLLRWSAFRIDDNRTPPTVLAKAGEFISSICEIMLSSGSSFGDYEASAVIPVLVDKCGSNRNVVRESMLAALLSVGDVMNDGRLIAYLVQSAWITSSVRSKLEIMSALPQILDRLFVGRGQLPSGTLAIISKLAYGSDESVGRAAAVCIDRVHQHVGDGVWELIGELSEEDADLLERRFALIAGGASAGCDEPASPRLPAQAIAADRLATPPSSAFRNPESFPMVPPAPSFPAMSIRPEDFRLSVAPAPPSSVMSALGDALAMRTPVRGARITGADQNNADRTPALPVRRGRPRGNFSFISSHQTSHVQSVIDLLESEVPEEQMQGLDVLFSDLNEPENTSLKERAPDVLPLVTHGFRDCVGRLQDGSTSQLDQVLLKKFLNAVMAFVRLQEVITRMNRESLELLLNDILDCMIPDEIPALQDWDRVRRGVNLAVLKILESCDRNLLFCTLFSLLVADLRVGSEYGQDGSAKSQLLIKSVAKITKRGFDGIKLDLLMRDLDDFVRRVTADRGEGNVLLCEGEPLRLVRTVVDTVIDSRGSGVFQHLQLIPSPGESSLVQYIHDVLPVPEAVDGTLVQKTSGTEPDCHQQIEIAEESGRISDSDHDAQLKLSEIFNHLVISGGDDAGLRRLRAFMLCYPEVKVEPCMSKCQKSLQDFIRKGLQNISVEDADVVIRCEHEEGLAQNEPLPINEGVNGEGSVSQDATESAGQAYLKRLREIQLKYGLPERSSVTSGAQSDSGPSDITAAPTTPSQPFIRESGGNSQGATTRGADGEKENGISERPPVLSISETRDKATALRERMARIRKASAE